MKNDKFSTVFVTLYLLVNTILLRLEVSLTVSLFMFSISPFLVISMVYAILKYPRFSGHELKENEEWGYQDKGPISTSIEY